MNSECSAGRSMLVFDDWYLIVVDYSGTVWRRCFQLCQPQYRAVGLVFIFRIRCIVMESGKNCYIYTYRLTIHQTAFIFDTDAYQSLVAGIYVLLNYHTPRATNGPTNHMPCGNFVKFSSKRDFGLRRVIGVWLWENNSLYGLPTLLSVDHIAAY